MTSAFKKVAVFVKPTEIMVVPLQALIKVIEACGAEVFLCERSAASLKGRSNRPGHPTAERAAMLATADLRTLMVGEFPELQGIMGEYYAKYDGEAEEVALAIREHYQPRYAGDALPSTPVSLATALADKMETLIGLFGIGQMPTGEKDPFALRRHALGVLRMLIEKALPVSLNTLIDAAWEAEKAVPGVTDHREELRQFFQDRLRVMLRDAGYTTLEVDAVLALNPEKLDELPKRLAAVRAFMALPEAEAPTAAPKPRMLWPGGSRFPPRRPFFFLIRHKLPQITSKIFQKCRKLKKSSWKNIEELA